MNGIINVLKPAEMTSHDVVSIMRRLLQTKKIGHTGTLDPNAVGVLPICIGKGTKVVEHLTADEKTYRCGLAFGSATDTQDRWGKTIATSEFRPSEEAVLKALEDFKGEILQVPPMYSALKVDGKKLVDLARQGIEVERQPRKQVIHRIEVIRIWEDGLFMDVTCSKGTYIRTLCHDLGEALGCHAHMTHLIRMASGVFKIEDALTLEEISYLAESNAIESVMHGVDAPFASYTELHISSNAAYRVLSGVVTNLIAFVKETPEDEQRFRIYANGEFIGIGAYSGSSGQLNLIKRLYSGDNA